MIILFLVIVPVLAVSERKNNYAIVISSETKCFKDKPIPNESIATYSFGDLLEIETLRENSDGSVVLVKFGDTHCWIKDADLILSISSKVSKKLEPHYIYCNGNSEYSNAFSPLFSKDVYISVTRQANWEMGLILNEKEYEGAYTVEVGEVRETDNKIVFIPKKIGFL